MACSIHGLLGLLLRSSGAVDSAIEVTAAQDFERPRLCYTHDASTARSSLVDFGLYCCTECHLCTDNFEEHGAWRPWIDAPIWLWHECHVASAGDVLETRETRRLIELFQRSVGHMYCMCSEERIF